LAARWSTLSLCRRGAVTASPLLPLSPFLSLVLGSAALSLVPRARLKVFAVVRLILRRWFFFPSIVGGPYACQQEAFPRPPAEGRPPQRCRNRCRQRGARRRRPCGPRPGARPC